jgi:predicted short-subunit dehydrogenase-like oxidoreductase (DUF2520 family)
MELSINIVGAGRLGKTLGWLIHHNQIGCVQGICNTSLKSAKKAVDFIGAGKAYSLANLPEADISFITVSDDVIDKIASQLSALNQFKRGGIFVHCSGALSSLVLDSLKEKGHFTASAHPMHNFAHPKQSIKTFPGTYCSLEGQKPAVDLIKRIFEKAGAHTFTIHAESKAIYHAAGVIASNYLVTLTHIATQCLVSAGIEENTALNLICQLTKGTVHNLETTQSCKQALIGPLVRGDLNAIKCHLAHLDDKDSTLYKILALRTLPLVDLPQEPLTELLKILE